MLNQPLPLPAWDKDHSTAQERHERKQVPDAFNHLFFSGELYSRSHHSIHQWKERIELHQTPGASEISAPVLPKPCDTPGLQNTL